MHTNLFSDDSLAPCSITLQDKRLFNKFSPEFLESVAYIPQCTKGRSLKKITLRDVDLNVLLYCDLSQYTGKLASINMPQYEPYRVKSVSSCKLKTLKYGTAYPVQKVLNDILGFRVVMDDFPHLDSIPEYFEIADLTTSKSVNDDYRGLHLYYLGDNRSLPIEIQIWKKSDYVLNKFLHDKVYKQHPASVGYAVVHAVAGIPREEFSNGMLDEILYGVLNKSI